MLGRVNFHTGLYQERKGCETEHRGEHLIQERFEAKKHDDAAKQQEVRVDKNIVIPYLASDADGGE